MDRLRQTITEAVHGQPQPTVTVLSSLLAVQDAIGYIPKVALEEVAAFTGKTVNDIWGVASFYPNFRYEPLCQHNVEVCWGTTCHLVGAMPVMESVLAAAGLQEAGDTLDNALSVGFNTCLGACSQAPVISVDHRLVGRISPENAARRVTELLTRSPAEASHGN